MNRSRSIEGQRGAAVIMAILLTMLLLLLGVALLGMSETEGLIAANDQWSEGAFQAAEAAVQESVDRLSIGTTDQVVPETGIGGDYAFYSGARDDVDPQPPAFVSKTPGPGYSVGQGTGYNPSGYQFSIFQINGTGVGPRNIEREVEVQVVIGPVSE